jgi:hypothetical protein
LAVPINTENIKIPIPKTIPKYFKGYFPIKTNIVTIRNIKAADEKLAGKINNIVNPTGIHNSINEDLKVIGSFCVLDKYLATKMIKIRNAKVDGCNEIPPISTHRRAFPFSTPKNKV